MVEFDFATCAYQQTQNVLCSHIAPLSRDHLLSGNNAELNGSIITYFFTTVLKLELWNRLIQRGVVVLQCVYCLKKSDPRHCDIWYCKSWPQVHIGGKNVTEYWDSLKKLQDFEKIRKRGPGCILSERQDSILINRELLVSRPDVTVYRSYSTTGTTTRGPPVFLYETFTCYSVRQFLFTDT